MREKKKEEFKIVINQTKFIGNFLCFILFNDELFVYLKKEILKSQWNDIHLLIDERIEFSKNENTKSIILIGYNLIKENEEKIEIQMIFEEIIDFQSWWQTYDELLNNY